jgi:hypothetical protein
MSWPSRIFWSKKAFPCLEMLVRREVTFKKFPRLMCYGTLLSDEYKGRWKKRKGVFLMK